MFFGGAVVLIIGVVGFIAWYAVQNGQQTTASKQRPRANLAPSIVEQITASVAKPGRVRATVTWEYNKFVGNKPDTDATVTLIPKGHQKKIDSSLDPIFARITFDNVKKELRDQGIYVGIVGGDGKALIPDVPAGTYTLIIISKNTNEHPDIAKFSVEQLARYFKDGGSARLHKVHITDLTVEAGEEVEYSHDFGNTFF